MSETKPTAYLDWSLNVECPNCGEEIDLSKSPHDDDGCFAGPIFNNNWDHLKNAEVLCTECEHEFEIEQVEY